MLKRLTILTLSALLFIPMVTFAAPQTFPELVGLLVGFINLAVPIIIALAVLGFFWGVSQYIFSAGDTSKIEDGRKLMIYGIIALFVMVSIWGILRLLSNTFLGSGGSTQQQYTPGETIRI